MAGHLFNSPVTFPNPPHFLRRCADVSTVSEAAEPAAATPTFTISDLAREFNITPRTIRFWEDQGLLAPNREGRNRVYTKRDRTRLKLAETEVRAMQAALPPPIPVASSLQATANGASSHASTAIYACKQCKDTFNTMQALGAHVRHNHKETTT